MNPFRFAKLTPQSKQFAPADSAENNRWERGEDVANPCKHCSAPRMDHYNGRCPP